MKIKKIQIRRNNKGWIRIVEAFAAVLLVLSVVLLIISRQRTESQKSSEIIKLEKYVLDYISEDETLRAYALSNNPLAIESNIQSLIPGWLNYTLRTCFVNQTYEDICAFPGAKPSGDVYVNEILIVANLTYYQNATKVKLFLWEK